MIDEAEEHYIEQIECQESQMAGMQRSIKALLKRVKEQPPTDIQELWFSFRFSIGKSCNEQLLELHSYASSSIRDDSGGLDDQLYERIDDELRNRLSEPKSEYPDCGCNDCKPGAFKKTNKENENE